ncbi:MAG: RNA methyltransferase [Myxococcales bacterium]|nr:RNA methyltransferase [Myxococcales bacterium]
MIIRPQQRSPRAVPDPRIAPPRLVDLLAPHLTPRRLKRMRRIVAQRLASITVLIERPYDPHNAAAVLRSAEALGLSHVHIVPHERRFDFSSQVTQRADKWLDVYLHDDVEQAATFLRAAGFRLAGALAPPKDARERDAPPAALPVDAPLAIVLGNEHEGLTPRARALCDAHFSLPMFGFSESYNLSVSAALVLSDVTTRRRARLGRRGDLPARARTRLEAAYLVRAVSFAERLVLRELGLDAR